MRFIKRVDFTAPMRPAVFCMVKKIPGFYRLSADTVILDEGVYHWWMYRSNRYCMAFPAIYCDHVLLFERDYQKPLPFSREGEAYQLQDFREAKRPISALTGKRI